MFMVGGRGDISVLCERGRSRAAEIVIFVRHFFKYDTHVVWAHVTCVSARKRLLAKVPSLGPVRLPLTLLPFPAGISEVLSASPFLQHSITFSLRI